MPKKKLTGIQKTPEAKALLDQLVAENKIEIVSTDMNKYGISIIVGGNLFTQTLNQLNPVLFNNRKDNSFTKTPEKKIEKANPPMMKIENSDKGINTLEPLITNGRVKIIEKQQEFISVTITARGQQFYEARKLLFTVIFKQSKPQISPNVSGNNLNVSGNNLNVSGNNLNISGNTPSNPKVMNVLNTQWGKQ